VKKITVEHILNNTEKDSVRKMFKTDYDLLIVKFKRLKTALSNIAFNSPVQVKFCYMTV